MALQYKEHLDEKAEKEKADAEKKAKKIARDEKARAEKKAKAEAEKGEG